jgi:hypothetical protein
MRHAAAAAAAAGARAAAGHGALPGLRLHLPRPNAVAGTSGRLYCSHEHRSTGGN